MCNILAGDDPLANGDRCHGVLEGSPLLPPAKETVISLDYGTYTPTSPAKKDVSLKDIKDANDDDDYDDEDAMDWWSKYFASVDLMIKEGVANRAESIVEQPIVTTHTKKTAQVMIPSRKTGMNPLKSTVLKWGTKLSPKVVPLSPPPPAPPPRCSEAQGRVTRWRSSRSTLTSWKPRRGFSLQDPNLTFITSGGV